MRVDTANFILYVADQATATAFWRAALDMEPSLNVPGMTEFAMASGVVLGLMPEKGIARLLGAALPDPANGNGVPRCEVYLRVQDPAAALARAVSAGARLLADVAPRDWGDEAGYCLAPDGHVLAFARPLR